MILALSFGCTKSDPTTELRRFPLDSLEGILTKTDVSVDRESSSDGRGSLRVSAVEPRVVRLFELADLDLEDTRLIYQAKVRTENIEGQVYLEMWCGFEGKGEFFSRGLQSPLSGSTDWSTLSTPFFLQKGQNPDYVKLNLVVDGKGTAWIDDIRLLGGPLS